MKVIGVRSNDEDEALIKRSQRRRRIQMRLLTAVSPTATSSPSTSAGRKEDCCSVTDGELSSSAEMGEPTSTSVSASSGEDSGASPSLDPDLGSASDVSTPVYGTMSIAGRRREMEDAILVRTNLCRPEINRGLPVNFFGLYDGHGGPHVAALCRDKMHLLLEEELRRVGDTIGSGSVGVANNWVAEPSTPPQQERQGLEEEEQCWRRVMARCFERMDAVATRACACGNPGFNQCGCHPMDAALSGSTAVVAVVTADHVVVANCGDSRAVLCRAGRAIPLSFDHKPERVDELARIQACGGRVIYLDGARVEGVLAMSRAIGDKYLKPSVTSEPEITFTRRDIEDEFIILASDGLWDVLSNDLACDVASECLREGHVASTSRELNTRSQMEDERARAIYPSPSASAAALLTRLALARKSSDNISVIVVDLKRS